MAPALPRHARRLLPSALLEPRSIAVLAFIVVGWMVFRALDSPDARAQASGAYAPRAHADVVSTAAPRNSAPGAAAAAPTVSAAASGPLRFPADLPLQRPTESETLGGATSFKVAIFCAALLAVAGAVLLRHRLGWPPAAGQREPRSGGWLRRLAPAASRPPLRVVQSARLTTRASVHVLRWDDRDWLVGCTEHGMTVLGERAAAAEPRLEPALDRPEPAADVAHPGFPAALEEKP